jgi:hypothetical protein
MGRLSQTVERIAHAWNAFNDSEQSQNPLSTLGGFGGSSSFGTRPDRVRTRFSNERSIITSIYTKVSVDFSGVLIRHVRLDDNDRYKETIKSGLHECLTVGANIDQAGRMFRQDIVTKLFDKGVIAVVPVETSLNPNQTGGYDILDLRVGEIVDWRPRHVKVDLYNDKTGKHVQIWLEKRIVAIIENPLYAIMNERNSTLQRLIRKLNLLDVVDEQASSGKLDLIVQLPYVIKNQTRRNEAEQRRKDIEFQLKGSQYGIAYTDGTEKITQLNRPAENNLLKTVEYLTNMLYGELGLTVEIMNGTADEAAMLNYYSRTIEPLLDAVVEEFRRKFLTKTARTQNQTIDYFRDPFKLVPLEKLGEISNQLSRNEIASANELRPFFGFKPSTDPKADKLNNSNINTNPPGPSEPAPTNQEGDPQNGS